jgi:G3E family GTPase
MKLPRIPQITSLHPLILFTGFLGAGKTTLLRESLIELKAAGLQADVILNDYADANVDSITLEEFATCVEPLTAACACCEGLDFLLDLSIKSAKSQSDILFIELNGTADPVPIVESFTLLENKLQLHPRWQICVIDVRHFGARGAYRDIEELQLQTASHIYFSHVREEYSPDSVHDQVREINPYASVVSKDKLLEMIVSLGKAKKQLFMEQQSEDKTSNLNLFKKSVKHPKSHEFTACQILLPTEVDETVIRNWLAHLPPGVIRAKVLVGLVGQGDVRYLFERVRAEVSADSQKVVLGKGVPNSAILIGPDLDLEMLQNLTNKYMENWYP